MDSTAATGTKDVRIQAAVAATPLNSRSTGHRHEWCE